ncbi:polyketide cyclase [Auraticoccus sp. F435]|uniref:Polyketide cyclase n=1 Tax=Auraticoccus cholistanensis TaxID=2656650 RepID=A0A6A9V083_9ACTN|nr:SRPBCC family protein [Auraticoccus cholistanensis]MVA75139.1 polyketide cyclase [Auraticoccus cholistanensis]
MTNPVTISAPEGLPFIDIVREFEAPVEKVFQAHADPELYARWIGPHGYETDLQRHDFTTGGGYRFVQRTPTGEEYAFNGVFHVVRRDELAVQTFEFEGAPDQISLEYLTFERLEGGRTRLVGHAVYPSVETRDAMVASGMQTGVEEGYQRLDDILDAG